MSVSTRLLTNSYSLHHRPSLKCSLHQDMLWCAKMYHESGINRLRGCLFLHSQLLYFCSFIYYALQKPLKHSRNASFLPHQTCRRRRLPAWTQADASASWTRRTLSWLLTNLRHEQRRQRKKKCSKSVTTRCKGPWRFQGQNDCHINTQYLSSSVVSFPAVAKRRWIHRAQLLYLALPGLIQKYPPLRRIATC